VWTNVEAKCKNVGVSNSDVCPTAVYDSADMSPTEELKLEVRSISKYFRRNGSIVHALDSTSIDVTRGRFVSIIGPSGCGKSTLFNVIAGLAKPTSGDVLADGQSIVGKPGYVGYMLQKGLLLPWRTILDNIILGMEVRDVPRNEAIARAMPLIQRYGLAGFEQHYPHELSGGMRQRASLLRTMLYDRDIVLLDEPFGALDAQTRLIMQSWLLDVWSDLKKTILFVTHDIDEAIYLSDEIHVFSARPGRIKARIDVSLARPRTQEAVTSSEFTALKRTLLDLLAEEAERAYDEAALL
jgi:ABC-type nitrate/sulfonate/bicarbonate transport system ATPase subunit